MLLLVKTIFCSVALLQYKLKNKKNILSQIKFVENPKLQRGAIVYLSWHDQPFAKFGIYATINYMYINQLLRVFIRLHFASSHLEACLFVCLFVNIRVARISLTKLMRGCFPNPND